MATYHKPDVKTLQALRDIANKLRILSIEATNASNSGHPTSCASMAEIMSTLFFKVMKYKPSEPRHPANDRFVLSKGHAAPILYAAWVEAGHITRDQLMQLRKIDNDLEGHPTPRLDFIDVATGSLGQGLGAACGMAYTGKYIDKAGYRVFCLLGDGESAEGSVSEAFAFASHYKLNNLVGIIDVNRLGQSEPTALQHQVEVYKSRAEAFGWNAIVVDGHDVEALLKVFHEAEINAEKPTCVIAKTFKGRGIEGIEDMDGWHGKPLGAKAAAAIETIKKQIVSAEHGLTPPAPEKDVAPAPKRAATLSEPPSYKSGDKVATRNAYGTALAKLGRTTPNVVGMDGDTKNSTFAITFQKEFPERFIECYIAEQNLVSVGIGCATRDRTIPFVSTFAAFLTRAFDQIRMGAISQTNCNFVGSHSGISIGEDGPSQMALEDLAMFRTIPGSTVFYPSDAVSCERAVELAASTPGVCFIRTSRPALPMIYANTEKFEVGKAKVVRQSDKDHVTIVASCVTLSEAVKAADALKGEGINVRIVDPFTIKPLDKETILNSARATGGKIITVEDHYPEGGIGEAVCSAVSECADVRVKKLCVNGVPRSGQCAELLAMFGIDSDAIIKAVKSF